MSEVSLNEQISCVEDMEDKLKDYCIVLEDTLSQLYKCIKTLRSDELTIEFADYYEHNYYIRTKTIVDQVMGDVEYGHLRFLDAVLEKLKSMRD